MEGVKRPAANDRPMKTSEAEGPGSESGTEAILKPEGKELPSRPPTSGPRLGDGVDLCGDPSTTQTRLSAPATDLRSREVVGSSSAYDARAVGLNRADSRPVEEATRGPAQAPSGFNSVAPHTANGPGDLRPATNLQNGERRTTADGENCCRVQLSSAEKTVVLSKGVESELSATARIEENLPSSSDSSGEGNRNGSPRGDTCIPSPDAGVEESSRLEGACVLDALFVPTGSEVVQRSGSAQVAGAAPDRIRVVESGGTSEALASEAIMERSGASAVWIAGRDQAQHAGQGHYSSKAATTRADVPEEKESVVLEEKSTAPSPSQPGRPSVSLESGRVDSSIANRAIPDAARTSEAGVAQTERSGNGTGALVRTGAFARLRAHGSGSQDGAGCQSLPGESVWGSTERLAPMSGHERGRVEGEHAERTPWGEPIEHESLGDTTDIALAAVSYANAVAEGGAVDSLETAAACLETTGTGEKTPPASDPTDAIENNPTVDPLVEREGDRIMPADATVASTISQPASRASSNGSVPLKVAEISKATGLASDTARALSSNGARMSTRGEKGSRASDHHDDMMHAMCMICLEKLSDSSEGGRAKLLGILDSCSHRYCYTVSRVALVAVEGPF